MVRRTAPRTPGCSSSPRAGGGGPLADQAAEGREPFSPRRRGWSADPGSGVAPGLVLPAQAGVVRESPAADLEHPGSPRAGGGGPCPSRPRTGSRAFSPRRRGWSDLVAPQRAEVQVLPAQAGVVRPLRPRLTRPWRSPRAGGGGPLVGVPEEILNAFSPRRRGWSVGQRPLPGGHGVLPAQAGVVRRATGPTPSACCSPRAGGGGPPRRAPRRPAVRSPRAGGGGPILMVLAMGSVAFSPRRRGWSVERTAVTMVCSVLPAQAGVVRRGSPP